MFSKTLTLTLMLGGLAAGVRKHWVLRRAPVGCRPVSWQGAPRQAPPGRPWHGRDRLERVVAGKEPAKQLRGHPSPAQAAAASLLLTVLRSDFFWVRALRWARWRCRGRVRVLAPDLAMTVG